MASDTPAIGRTYDIEVFVDEEQEYFKSFTISGESNDKSDYQHTFRLYDEHYNNIIQSLTVTSNTFEFEYTETDTSIESKTFIVDCEADGVMYRAYEFTIWYAPPSLSVKIYSLGNTISNLLHERYISVSANNGLTTLVDFIKDINQTIYPVITMNKPVETDKGDPIASDYEIATSLNTLGKKLAKNLTDKRVYSVNTEGLTTLVNKIKDIPDSNFRNFTKFVNESMTGTIQYESNMLPIQNNPQLWTGTFSSYQMRYGGGLNFVNSEVYTNTEFTSETNYTLRFSFDTYGSKVGFYYGTGTDGQKNEGYGFLADTGTLYIEDYNNGTSWDTGYNLQSTNEVEIKRTLNSVTFRINGELLTDATGTTTSFNSTNNTLGFKEWANAPCNANYFRLDSETIWGYGNGTTSGIILDPIDNTRNWTITLDFYQNRWDSHFGLYLGTEEEGNNYDGNRILVVKSAGDSGRLSFYNQKDNINTSISNPSYTANTWNTITFQKNGTNMKFYQGTTLRASFSWNELADHTHLHIGGSVWGNSNGASNPSGIKLRNITVTYEDDTFIDYGVIGNHNDHWYINRYGTATVQDNGTKLLNTSGDSSFVMRSIIPSNKTITQANSYSYNPPYVVEFDIVETDGTSGDNAQVQIYSDESTGNFAQAVSTGHYKIKITSEEQKIWLDDTLIKTTNLSLPNARITLRVRQGKYLIYKNFKVSNNI